jgi:hypothetical protein
MAGIRRPHNLAGAIQPNRPILLYRAFPLPWNSTNLRLVYFDNSRRAVDCQERVLASFELEEAMTSSMQDVRRQVREQIRRRGRRKFYVCKGYAIKGGFPFALDGMPNTMHLIWMEGDPNIVKYEIPAHRIVGQGIEGPHATVPDAICTLRSGAIQWREIKTVEDGERIKQNPTDQILAGQSAAAKYGAEWLLVTTRDLDRHEVLIRNWRKGLGYMWTTIDFDLQPYLQDLRRLVRTGRALSLRQVVQAYPDIHQSLLFAAFFRLAGTGEIETNLDKVQFSWATVLRGA